MKNWVFFPPPKRRKSIGIFYFFGNEQTSQFVFVLLKQKIKFVKEENTDHTHLESPHKA
jgi:hypothetical protein